MALAEDSSEYQVLPAPRSVQNYAEPHPQARLSRPNIHAALRWRPSWLNYWQAFFMAFVVVVGSLIGTVAAASAVKEAGVSLGVIPLGGIVLAGLIVLGAVIDRWRRYYELKPDGHLIQRYGIIAKSTDEVRVQDIRLLRVKQGIIQRLFRLGDIEVATAGHSDVEIHMRGIIGPEVVKEAIRALQAAITTDTRVFSTE
jgi:uncharacterized membrane protein YdbT with pleckstrin-like domain